MLTIIMIGAIVVMTLLVSSVSNVYASGPRLDSPEDSTYEGGACWVDGYDSGFASKYDKDRADECQNEENDEYNEAWNYACEDAGYTEAECNGFKNNPVEIEDYEALNGENNRTCYDTGIEDGLAGKPFNKVRSNGCNEFDDIGGGYEGGYQFGCEVHTAESTCELKYEDKKYYCPNHPDVGGCAEFLQNATNKKPEPATCATFNTSVSCFSYQEDNPEKYCLEYDSPRCNEVGDLCDEDGFVRPEYPYCTNKEIRNVNASSKPETVPPVITGGTGSGSGSMCPDGYQRTEDGENCRLRDAQCDEDPDHSLCNGERGVEGLIFCDVLYQETGGKGSRCYDRNDNPEQYCLMHPGNPWSFCTKENICDQDGSVKPEDLYCTNEDN